MAKSWEAQAAFLLNGKAKRKPKPDGKSICTMINNQLYWMHNDGCQSCEVKDHCGKGTAGLGLKKYCQAFKWNIAWKRKQKQ